ncbi:MAG: ABC transporter ATP-binding protein, partial [Cellulosimicrobium funkei]
SDDAWDGTVVGSVFRRGAVEVTVDVDLPGRSGGAPARLVALAGAPAVVEPGDRVRVVVDPAGCAVVPA